MNSPLPAKITADPDKISGVQIEQPADSRCIDTTCPYCGTGCGISAEVTDTELLNVNGDPNHPANSGTLCSKGSNLIETLDLEARLLHPEVDGQRVDWDQALSQTAERIGQIIDQHGPDAFAIYCSGQLLTEDYYVANKLMKGFIGSANIDTNSRLCMASAVAGHKRAFGSDSVPGCYEDLELADLVVLTGSNMAWCHPILFQRLKKAKLADPERKLVVIDPRRTDSCDIADLHLPLKPGSDAVLYNGLLVYLADQLAFDFSYIENHTQGIDQALAQARRSAPSISSVADQCQLPAADVETFFRWFADTPKAVTAFSQGVNQSSSGTDKVNAILNIHLASGRIGKPGASPLSLTGQPNAMGGREVGGLANQLAAHMELDNPQHRGLVSRFWKSDRLADKPGLKAVDLFRAIETGKIKGVWVIATNPVDSLPDADRVAAALEHCPLVIQSDCMAATDTGRYADIRLPATGWGEKDGTVTNAERRISRQRALLPASGEAKPDWWILAEIGKRLGYEQAFDYQAPWQIFREHARLSAQDNHPDATPRSFNLAALAEIDAEQYQQLQPVQWPVSGDQPNGRDRLFSNGGFFSADGKARFIAIEPRQPANPTCNDYPLLLNTGRLRDQWHTMTRTGLSPRLSSHRPEPCADLHPRECSRIGLQQGDLIQLHSRWGSMLARVNASEGVNPGQLFVPMHWTEQYASQGRVCALVNPAVDPISGQPESKQTPVRVESFKASWHGFLLSRQAMEIDCDYRVSSRSEHCQRLELADRASVNDWSQQAEHWFNNIQGQRLEYCDSAKGSYRLAIIDQGQLQAVLMVAPTPQQLPERDWLACLFGQPLIEPLQRRQLLSGVPADSSNHPGQVVCACFGVGRNTLKNAIEEQGLDSVEAIGCALKAGTNCGSCVPEIKSLL